MVVATALMGPHERVSRTHVPADVRRCTVRCGGIWLLARCQMSDVARDSVSARRDRSSSADIGHLIFKALAGDVRDPARTRW